MASVQPSRNEVKHSNWRGKAFAGVARDWLLRTAPERLVCLGRLVTAVFAILAIYLDPTRPNSLLYESRVVLFLYLTMSLVLVLFPLRISFVSPLHLIVHIVDALVVGSLTFLTNELASPFFAILPFVILAMTMRWGLKGAALGAIIALTVQFIVGFSDLSERDSELNLFIMRSLYYVLSAATLGYFGAYRERNRQRLAKLAQWPIVALGEGRTAWLGSLLEHAASVLGDAELLVLWREQELASGSVAHWSNGRLQLVDIDESEFWLQHDPNRFSAAESGNSLKALFAKLPEVPAMPDKSSGTVSCAAFSSIRYRGCVFVINPTHTGDDGDALTQIIATRLGSELERVALISAARSQERMRLARDLHDSVLQNLTAARLKLKLVGAGVPDSAKAQLAEVGSIVFEQQTRLRKFVEDNRTSEHDDFVQLRQEFPQYLQQLKTQWNCDIDVTSGSTEMMVPKRMFYEIMQLMSEATANAVRHGGATRLDVTLAKRGDVLEFEISDNGVGQSDAVLRQPLSLADRVGELGGKLTIYRTSPGFGLQITLPSQSESSSK